MRDVGLPNSTLIKQTNHRSPASLKVYADTTQKAYKKVADVIADKEANSEVELDLNMSPAQNARKRKRDNGGAIIGMQAIKMFDQCEGFHFYGDVVINVNNCEK